MDPKKRKKVLDFKVPSNRRELGGILVIDIFLSKFCPELASWSSTLLELQGENAPWGWSDTNTRALEIIKELVNSPQILKPWDHFSETPKYLVWYACDSGLGSWIGQGELGSIQPCHFYSQKFSPLQLKYPTYHKELLAIVDSLKFFESQLQDHKFTVLTDHKPIFSFPDHDKHLRSWPDGKLTCENSPWSLNIQLEKKTCWQTIYKGSINTPSIPPRNKTSSHRASILQQTTATFRTLLSLPTTFLSLPYYKKSQ